MLKKKALKEEFLNKTKIVTTQDLGNNSKLLMSS
jgi:hypothetical protein